MQERYLRRTDFSNRSKRVPVCFCIDTSASMEEVVEGLENVKKTGEKVFKDQCLWSVVEDGITLMKKLNEGVANFYQAIISDEIACDSCEAAIVTFDDTPKLYDGFSTVEEKEAPDFRTSESGNTNLTPAIRMSIDILKKQLEFYESNKIPYYRPWLVLFTDGRPSDDVTLIKKELMRMQEGPRPEISVYTIALSNKSDVLNALRGFSKKPPIECADPNELKRFFNFVAKSVSKVAAGGVPDEKF